MTLAVVQSRAVVGLNALLVHVEVHLSQGLPALSIVGLPEAAVRESKDRVRSAIINSGFQFPNRRITINLAPADLPKEGARLDLPIALGILAASGQLVPDKLQDFECVGELALNGDLRTVTGVLAIARAVKGERFLVVPQDNAQEATQLPHAKVLAGQNLKQIVEHINGQTLLPLSQYLKLEKPILAHLDMADVRGQYQAKRALEIAAAGGHSILLSGPPGSGKTLLASRLSGLLPPMTDEESLEVASIYSIANVYLPYGIRPFRSPHHTASSVALVGGGSSPKPGEITLAHCGVLFLDELPEFDRKVLEVLRQPLESKEVVISRAARQVTFPAQFQLVAAMNPCPCGFNGDGSARCKCSVEQIKRYQGRLSGPLLDRIDLHIKVPALPIEDLQKMQTGETSAAIAQRVLAAREMQLKRQQCANAQLAPQRLDEVVQLADAQKQLLKTAQQRLNLSARAYHRIMRVARTIADLAQSESVLNAHITEAISYRGSDLH